MLHIVMYKRHFNTCIFMNNLNYLNSMTLILNIFHKDNIIYIEKVKL